MNRIEDTFWNSTQNILPIHSKMCHTEEIIGAFRLSCTAGPVWHNDHMTWWYIHITGPLWGESASDCWIPLTDKKLVMQSFDAFFIISLWSGKKKTVEWPVIFDAMMLMWRHCKELSFSLT